MVWMVNNGLSPLFFHQTKQKDGMIPGTDTYAAKKKNLPFKK
jgi:hypothetical protein